MGEGWISINNNKNNNKNNKIITIIRNINISLLVNVYIIQPSPSTAHSYLMLSTLWRRQVKIGFVLVFIFTICLFYLYSIHTFILLNIHYSETGNLLVLCFNPKTVSLWFTNIEQNYTIHDIICIVHRLWLVFVREGSF